MKWIVMALGMLTLTTSVFAGEVPRMFQGQWAMETQKTDTKHVCQIVDAADGRADVFKINAREINGYEWGCTIKRIEKQKDRWTSKIKESHLRVYASCWCIGCSWKSQGIWNLITLQGVEYLVMSSIESNWVSEDERLPDNVDTIVARRCSHYEAPD